MDEFREVNPRREDTRRQIRASRALDQPRLDLMPARRWDLVDEHTTINLSLIHI